MPPLFGSVSEARLRGMKTTPHFSLSFFRHKYLNKLLRLRIILFLVVLKKLERHRDHHKNPENTG